MNNLVNMATNMINKLDGAASYKFIINLARKFNGADESKEWPRNAVSYLRFSDL